MKNLQFNRTEKNTRNTYINDFEGIRQFDEFEHQGYIKCKLVHGNKNSLIIPDQIYVEVSNIMYWIQPLYFSANLISQNDSINHCELAVDISHGALLKIYFKGNNAISWMEDGSILYKCSIKGPRYLHQYRTGNAKFHNGLPHIMLYHHTNASAKQGIKKGSEYWTSNWNIQGTKKSLNISYLYLTSLPKLSNIDDLEQIAMSSKGKIGLRVDKNQTLSPDLILDVYRESTINRNHRLSQWVNAAQLSPQPCYKHQPPNSFVYYAIVSPFIQRIGVKEGTTVLIKNGFLNPEELKSTGYIIVGDATTINGLKAPYDEEETEEKLLIEYLENPEEITEFWMKNPNTNQRNNKSIEEIAYEQTVTPTI